MTEPVLCDPKTNETRRRRSATGVPRGRRDVGPPALALPDDPRSGGHAPGDPGDGAPRGPASSARPKAKGAHRLICSHQIPSGKPIQANWATLRLQDGSVMRRCHGYCR